MSDRFTIVDAQPLALAVIAARVPWPDLPATIMRLSDRVTAAVAAQSVRAGPYVVVYRHGDEVTTLIEAGMAVTGAFLPAGDAMPLSTPSGRIATTTHLGAYDGLKATHMALREWCAANGHGCRYLSWETYVEEHPDPARLRTQVSIQIDP